MLERHSCHQKKTRPLTQTNTTRPFLINTRFLKENKNTQNQRSSATFANLLFSLNVIGLKGPYFGERKMEGGMEC